MTAKKKTKTRKKSGGKPAPKPSAPPVIMWPLTPQAAAGVMTALRTAPMQYQQSAPLIQDLGQRIMAVAEAEKKKGATQ